MPSQIRINFEGAVEIIAFHNPPANLISNVMLRELYDELRRVRDDDAVRALVLTGALQDAFILHYDLNELLEYAQTAAVKLSDSGYRRAAKALYWLSRTSDSVSLVDLDMIGRLMTSGSPAQQGVFHWGRCLHLLDTFNKPVIAAINGACMGGGCELSLCCDFRLMARGEHYLIGLHEVLVGIIPGGNGTTQRLPRIVGEGRALEMLMTGKGYTADEAEAMGLVHRALEPDRVMPEALELAGRLSRGAPLALSSIRQAVRQGSRLDYHEGRIQEMQATLAIMASEDAQQGMRRYVEEVQNPLCKGEAVDPAEYLDATEVIREGKAVKYRGR
jgi:enoyl-CoA hydratase/carnithine racemase